MPSTPLNYQHLKTRHMDRVRPISIIVDPLKPELNYTLPQWRVNQLYSDGKLTWSKFTKEYTTVDGEIVK
jgi:hypothetical protein